MGAKTCGIIKWRTMQIDSPQAAVNRDRIAVSAGCDAIPTTTHWHKNADASFIHDSFKGRILWVPIRYH